MSKTKIEWTRGDDGKPGKSWNALLGCSKVSAGCKNCYAERFAKRLRHMEKNRPETKRHYTKVVTPAGWNGYSHFIPDRLHQPRGWKKPRKIFVCSMGDLFFERHSAGKVRAIFRIIMSPRCQHHTFIILTKRPKEMAEYIDIEIPNVWLGITAENQKQLEERMKHFVPIPAVVKFISYEPALDWIFIGEYARFIDWVIAGCESGSGRRRSSLSRFRQVRDDCEFHGIPFFLKQMDIKGRLIKMPELDGQIYDQRPSP